MAVGAWLTQLTQASPLWLLEVQHGPLRIGPAIVLSDGRVQLQSNGASGQGVRVQRSANLVDWEDWRTVTLEGTGGELIDETAAVSQRCYRAVEDDSVATK